MKQTTKDKKCWKWLEDTNLGDIPLAAFLRYLSWWCDNMDVDDEEKEEGEKDKDLTVNVDDAATLAALCSHLCQDKS